MSRIASCCTATAAFLTVLTVVGCSDKSGSQTSQSWIDSSITEYHPLGWLGGRAHPATRTVLVANDDGAEIAVGGMVVTELDADGPLAQAGAARGDVLVRVGETWLPNKDDPSLDLIRAVEAEVSAMVQPIRLSVLRDGTVQQLSLAHEMKPMEVGLPAASKRLGEIAQAGLRNLAESQAEDGSFPAANEDVSQSVATCSVAGLAFIAGGASADDSPFAQALEQCRARVEKAISNKESELSAWSLSWAAMFLAECAGPLEIAAGAVFNIGQALPSFTPSGGKPVVMKMDSGRPGQAQHSGGMRTFSFKSEGSLPEGMDLEELQKNGQVQIIRMGPGGGMPGAAISGSAPTSEMADEPLWTVEQLQAIAGEESAERIKPLLEAVRRLVALQEEPGGWDARGESLGYSQRTVTTNQALMALGMAQRAGAPVAGKVLKRGLEFLRASTNDGHVFAVSEEGFDRRLEAGRSAGAAAALIALNCDRNDEFLRELVSFNDKHAGSISEARAGVALHLLNTAILHRQRGRASWAVFFEEFRDLIVSLQSRDGSFDKLPGKPGALSARRELRADSRTRTAMWSLVAALQDDQVPLLTATAAHPLLREITSDGKLVAGMSAPAAGQAMDPEEARKMLEKMGIDLNEIMRNSTQPPADKP